MPRYSTKQRDVLLAFLEEHAHEALTAKQITEGLSGEQISPSAVYRNLAELERSGELRKSIQPGVRDAVYQYVAAKHCRGHVHLSCKACGKTFHLEKELTQRMVSHFEDSVHFTVIPADTVIFGICQNCQSK